MKKNNFGLIPLFSILVLIQMIIIPLVNADNPSSDLNPIPGNRQSTKYTLDALKIEQQRPPELAAFINWSSVPPAIPIENERIISIIIPEEYIIKHNMNTNEQNVILSLDSSEFYYQMITTKNEGKTLFFKDIKPNENVTLLRVPESIYSYLNTDPKKVIIHFPSDHFKVFDNLNELNNFNLQTISNSPDSQCQINIQPKIEIIPDELRTRWHWYGSRVYETIPDEHSIIWVSGKIRPESYSNSGNEYYIYQEREIFLDGTNDVIEFIVEYQDYPLNNIKLWCKIYDGVLQDYRGYINVPRDSLPHQYDYYFIMGKRGLGEYEMWFYDPLASPGQDWYAFFYTDSTPSTKIKRISGSSELWLDWDSLNYYFHARTSPISDEWNLDINDIWFKPIELYIYSGSTEDPYVGVWTMWDEYGTFHSYLYCDSQ